MIFYPSRWREFRGAFDPNLGYYIINTTDSGEIGYVRAQDAGSQRGRPHRGSSPGQDM